MSIVKRVNKLGMITIPRYVADQLQYEVIMGSFAYGVTSDTSDTDIYGFCIPPKHIIFPHMSGKYVHGFDTVPNNFEQWQQHHIKDPSYKPPKEFDFVIYNIVKYFKLCANGNPNMIDSLFVPLRCITHSTQIGNLVREKRHLFLSKKIWHSFKGYAYSQMHKMRIKNPTGKRRDMIDKYGFDVKFGYHVVRLLGECEQLLIDGDMDLELNREQLKDIRRGRWSQDEIEEYFGQKERDMEQLYLKSDLPYKPRWTEIRDLLFRCLYMHGYTDKEIKENTSNTNLLIHDVQEVLDKYKKGE